ncbi:MAG: electron transfer flavoprotein subunit beta/FixA family protein [Chloroflexota bacterium]
MNIVICVKQVPDTTAKKVYGPDLRFNRAALDSVINPFDEYAIEEGLRLRDLHGGDVTVLSMGLPSAEETLRKALAMGADRGVLVTDPALAGSDWLATAKVLAAVLRSLSFDLIVTGMESTDARTGLVPGGLAELLAVPCLTYASRLEVADGTARVHRQISGGYQVVTAGLPAVVSVVKGVNEPRYPSLKGIMAAKRKEIKKLALADLDVAPDTVGYDGAKVHVVAVTPRPEKVAGDVVREASAEETARRIADFLQEKKFI